MVFCNGASYDGDYTYEDVTILILVDGFLQYVRIPHTEFHSISHNPYFSRWFSAIITAEQLEDFMNESQSLF